VIQQSIAREHRIGMAMQPYYVRNPTSESRCVEVWSGYQLQFGDQRGRRPWQEDLAGEMKAALRALALARDETLAGAYAITDPRDCDVENRLVTNPGTKVTGQPQAISFERSPLPPPPSPFPVWLIDGQLRYYRYRPAGSWQWWEPDELLASWTRVPRRLADDGSARPTWLAMRMAAAQGRVTVPATTHAVTTVFGVRLTLHATPAGPRSAAAACEPLIDGVISAFHGGDPRPQIASRGQPCHGEGDMD
jgi:hypothetical protein